MGDRKKKIRRMLRELLKSYCMDHLVKLESTPDGVGLVVEGCEDAVFSIQTFIKERIETYAACTYEDLKQEMRGFMKEVMFVRARGKDWKSYCQSVLVAKRDKKGFAFWANIYPVKNMEDHP